MIDPRLAVIFEARLAWTQEIDKEMKLALWRKFEEELEKFCKQEGIQLSPGDFCTSRVTLSESGVVLSRKNRQFGRASNECPMAATCSLWQAY